MQLSKEIAPGVSWLRTVLVNVVFVEPEPRNGSWVLVDAGLAGHHRAIVRAARARYGTRPPAAIVLTHAHFDHVGNLRSLADHWDVPIYAHPLELPHLTGRSSYPPPDPTVGGGLMAWAARLYPCGPVDVSTRVRTLPDDGSIPPLPGWRWWHTPGHTDGHVSLFRDSDRMLVSGDAVITVKQESVSAVLTQAPTLHGPPAYFTTNWSEALGSVRDLADLSPNGLVPGHGLPMTGPRLTRNLRAFADSFHREIPEHGRYVAKAARRREDGRYDLPPDPWPAALRRMLAGLAMTSFAGAWFLHRQRQEQATPRPRPLAAGSDVRSHPDGDVRSL
jgi:glyoxylase-like metal-dependent hydrolase (beta-lactamase superfamily II)